MLEDRKQLLKKELNRIKETIIKHYLPEKLILFGSMASGNIHEWSDIDLVIIKKTNDRFMDRLNKVSFMSKPKVGINFLVYTPEEIQRLTEQKHYFLLEEILKKGTVIYERDK